MPLISVIVPVYNVEKYLAKCLDSLVSQTIQDLEIIVINDGSTDSSYNIMELYADKYTCIHIYNQENMGISYTRNKGIELAQGTYISFIDSDDYVREDMFERLYEKAHEEQLDLTVCDFYEVYEKEQRQEVYKLPSFESCALKDMPSLLFDINASPWNKLYRRDFIMEQQLRFPSDVKYEDTYVLLNAFLKAKNIGKVDQPLLYYIIHEGSETTVMDRRVFDIFKVLKMINEDYRSEKAYPIYKEQLEYFNANRVSVYVLQQIYQKDKSIIGPFIDHAYAFLDQEFPDWRKNQPFYHANSFVKRWIKYHKTIAKLVVFIKRRMES